MRQQFYAKRLHDDIAEERVFFIRRLTCKAETLMQLTKYLPCLDDVGPVVLIVVPVICVLLVATIGFYICYVDKTQKKTKVFIHFSI